MLSDEINSIDKIENLALNRVECTHYNDKFHAIFLLLQSSFLRGESSILHIEESDRSIVQYMIEQLSFKDAVLEVYQNKIIERDWYRMKNIAKKSLESVQNRDVDAFIYNYNRLKIRFKKEVHKLREPLFGAKTYSDLLSLAQKASNMFSSDHIAYAVDNSQFDFNQSEFWKIKNAVEQAVTLFDKRFIALANSNMFSVNACNILVDEDDSNAINIVVQGFKDRCLDLLTEYNVFVKDFIRKDRNKINNDINIAISITTDLYDKIQLDKIYSSTKEKKGLSFPFRKPKNELSKYLDQFGSILKLIKEKNILDPQKHEVYKTEYPSVEVLEKYLNMLIIDLNNEILNSKKKVWLAYKRMNTQNDSTGGAKILDKELTSLIEDLNKLSIYDSIFENNSLSIHKQIDCLESLSTVIISSQYFLEENTDLLFWESFMSQQPDSIKNIIKSIILLPKGNWMNAFISWYLNQLVENFDFDVENYNSIYNEYNKANTLFPSFAQTKANINWLNKQVKSLKLLKATDKNIFNDIFKKSKATNDNYYSLLNSSGSLLPTLFPITIIYKNKESKDYSKLNALWSNVHYSYEISNFPEPVTYKSLLYIRNEDTDSSTLKIKHNYTPIVNFKMLTNLQQLDPAKELANRLVVLCDSKIDLLVADNCYIVSTLNNDLLARQIENLNLNHVKSYNNSGNLIDNLTDIVLVNDNKMQLYLLIEFGILNKNRTHNIDWQLNLLDLYRKAGFEIVDFTNLESRSTNNDIVKLKTTQLVDEID